MNLGKNPLLFIALLFVLLLVVSQAFSKRGSSKQLSEKELTQRTALARVHVDTAEQTLFQKSGSYTDSVSDLIGVDKTIKDDLADGILITLDTGADNKSFTAQINSRTLLYLFGRDAGKETVSTCRKIRNSAKDYCSTNPVKPPKDDQTGKLTTTDSTTTESTSTTSK